MKFFLMDEHQFTNLLREARNTAQTRDQNDFEQWMDEIIDVRIKGLFNMLDAMDVESLTNLKSDAWEIKDMIDRIKQYKVLNKGMK